MARNYGGTTSSNPLYRIAHPPWRSRPENVNAKVWEVPSPAPGLTSAGLGSTAWLALHLILNASTQIQEPAEAASCVPVTTIIKVCSPGLKPPIE